MQNSIGDSIEIYKTNVDKKLLARQILFPIIIGVLVVLSIINIFEGKINILLAVFGFSISILVGLAVSRMFKIFWHEEKNKVISKLDTTGVIILVFYISFEINRTWIFGYWLEAEIVNAFGLIVLSGLLLGRFLGTFVKIKNVLIENNKIDID